MTKKNNKHIESNDEDDISLDISKYKKIFSDKNNLKILGTILFLIIPILLSIFLRIQPAYLPITDDWAENSVYSNIKNNIKAQINVQYPNLPEENKNKIVNEEFQKIEIP